MTHSTLSTLFQNAPSTWGLRGDPYLWNEMKEVLGGQPYPDSEEDFLSLLERTYRQLAGKPTGEIEPVFVARYSHGGMSGGYVDPKFWSEVGFPLLLQRYRETR